MNIFFVLLKMEVKPDSFDNLLYHCVQKSVSCNCLACHCSQNKCKLIESKNSVNFCSRHCVSNSNLFKKSLFKSHSSSNLKNEFNNFKRSLKLLGIEKSVTDDFIDKSRVKSKRKILGRPLSIPTPILSRSVPLELSQEQVRKAWTENFVDDNQRKLISKAVYEEWYLKKQKESRKKWKENNIKAIEMKEKAEKELELKKAKSQQEFLKWLKKKQVSKKESITIKPDSALKRLTKSEEESQKAFCQWKKKKEKALLQKKKEKVQEEERKAAIENQKIERKSLAEKAFEQWKRNMKKNKQCKSQKEKKNDEISKTFEDSRKKSETSFFTWKAQKDKEINEKLKRELEIARLEKKRRSTFIKKRLYSAQQAYEEWLKKTDQRSKSTHSLNKSRPWLPL